MATLRLLLAAMAWTGGFTVAMAMAPAVVVTAGSTSAPPAAPASTAANDQTAGQISAWIHTDGDGSVQEGDSTGSVAPRAVHGEVGIGAGSNGFSTEYGVADIPIGRTGDLVVAASNADAHLRGRGGDQGRSLAVGLYLNGAAPASSPCGVRGDRMGLGPGIASPAGYGAGPSDYAIERPNCAESAGE